MIAIKIIFFYFQSGTATGTCGTVSWQIEHLDTRLIVMWSVPFNYNIHDSYFAVGMIFNRGRFTSSSYWFNQMYYSEKGPYKRGAGGHNITFENSAIVVHATMEPSTYHPMLNISVLPQVSFGSSQFFLLYSTNCGVCSRPFQQMIYQDGLRLKRASVRHIIVGHIL